MARATKRRVRRPADQRRAAARQAARSKPPREIAAGASPTRSPAHPARRQGRDRRARLRQRLPASDAWLAGRDGARDARWGCAHDRRRAARGASTTRRPTSPSRCTSATSARPSSATRIKRALRAVGYEVIADNHLGDWGTQFGKLIVAYRRWLDAERLRQRSRSPSCCASTSSSAKRRSAAGRAPRQPTTTTRTTRPTPARRSSPRRAPSWSSCSRATPTTSRLWKQFVDVSMHEFERVYRAARRALRRRARARASTTIAWPRRSSELLERGIAEESQRRDRRLLQEARRHDELPPFLVRKADGGFTTAPPTWPALLYRVERWNPARIIIVTDERQQLHFQPALRHRAAARRHAAASSTSGSA